MTGPVVDAAGFREHFPVLADTVYLASCSQGALSVELDAALAEFRYTMRAHGAPWPQWMEQVERARVGFGRLVGAGPDRIAVLPSASVGAYQVASTRDWSDRPVIVSTEMEFPSVAHVWGAQRARGATVRMVPERDGLVDPVDYLAAIDERTGLVSVPLVSYRNGLRLPVREVVARARQVGAPVFVDAYQAAGAMPVDVSELDCDFLVAGVLKYLLGIPGIAFLYARAGVPDQVAPQLTGWFGRVDPFAFDPTTVDYPDRASRYETGTPAIPSAYSANAGLSLLARCDPTAIDRHVRGLADALSARLAEDGERLWSPADPLCRGPMVAMFDDEPERLAGWLAARRVVASPRGPVLRLSLHYYNDLSDVDALCDALRRYRRAG
ncbi:MAG TPA: aminotransferase class V-fold PLP-dependent enzyme [Mycobacteriales bacterium]|nr:aminotransferase class V-fold PLP-dependent enzyme [Mycobacteriales bacterium]